MNLKMNVKTRSILILWKWPFKFFNWGAAKFSKRSLEKKLFTGNEVKTNLESNNTEIGLPRGVFLTEVQTRYNN